MPGGLLQLASSGVQDKYLTHLPEITFFKSVYRRHTTFSLESKEIYFDINPEYGEVTSVIIPNTGDLIYRIYLEVDIPTIDLKISSLNNSETFLNFRNNFLDEINRKKTRQKLLYDNLKNYADYQIDIYNTIKIVFQSENFTLINLTRNVILTNNKYTEIVNTFYSSVDEEIRNNVDLANYILELNSIENLVTIKADIEKRYQTLLVNLKKYYFRYLQLETEYNDLVNEQVKVSWSKYLGHYFVENYEIAIGGQIIDAYSSDQLQIYQEHYLPESKKELYYKMIGHSEDLYSYSGKKNSKKIIIPLIFWFNRSCGSALPIIAMKYSDIKLNFKFNKKSDLIALENWDEEYDSLLKIYLEKSQFTNTYSAVFNGYLIDEIIIYPEEITLDFDTDYIIYTPKYINKFVLKNKYSALNNDDLNNILINYGTNDLKNLPSSYPSTINTYYIKKYQWNNFRRDLPTQSYKDNIFDYHNYLDKNYLLNVIKGFEAKLIVEYIFLDDVEREKFSDSHLEYIIETFEENEFSVNRTEIYNSEIDFGKTLKELIWYIQPELELQGISDYSVKKRYQYSNWNWENDNSIVNKYALILNQTDILENVRDVGVYELLNQFVYLNNKLPDGVNYHSFSLFPEETQPSGCINLSQFKKKMFTINFNKKFLENYFNSKLNPNGLGFKFKVLGRSYNVLTISNGRGKLIFY